MRVKIIAAVIIFVSACLLPGERCFAAGQGNIAIILSSDIEPYARARNGFRQFLAKNGVSPVPGDYNLEKMGPQETLKQITRSNPAVVLAVGTSAAKFAKENLPGIPVVFCMVLAPSAVAGLNVTGVSMDIPAAVKLGKMKEALPKAKRIGVLYSAASSGQRAEIAQACDDLGLTLVDKKIASEKEFPDALKAISWRIDYLLMLPDPAIYFAQSVQFLLLESLRNKFPVIGLSASYTKAGALLSFDGDYEDMGGQAGEIGLRLLRGATPREIPYSKPRNMKISINMLAAERLEVKIPSAIIAEAAEVFGR